MTAEKMPTSIVVSLGLHGAALVAFGLLLRDAPRRAPLMVSDVDLLIRVPKPPRLSALDFVKLALPARKAARAAVRARMARRMPRAPAARGPEVLSHPQMSAARDLKAAQQGESAAQFSVAGLYYLGHGVAQNYEAAASWYRKAAAQGSALAQTNLGTMYYEGRGVPQNFTVALSWYRKAADQGHPAAQYIVGAMYEQGHGTAADDALALSWYRKAADQGDPSAQYRLGLAYENGTLGLAENEGRALAWYRAAAAQNYAPPARKRAPADLWERALAERPRRR